MLSPHGDKIKTKSFNCHLQLIAITTSFMNLSEASKLSLFCSHDSSVNMQTEQVGNGGMYKSSHIECLSPKTLGRWFNCTHHFYLLPCIHHKQVDPCMAAYSFFIAATKSSNFLLTYSLFISCILFIQHHFLSSSCPFICHCLLSLLESNPSGWCWLAALSSLPCAMQPSPFYTKSLSPLFQHFLVDSSLRN